MLFLLKKEQNIKNITASLQSTYFPYFIFNSNVNPHKKNPSKERVSLFVPFCKAYKGSMTVETALVLPIFLFAMICILYLCEVIQYSNAVAQSLHQTAREMAVYAYTQEAVGIQIPASSLGSIALSETYVAGKLKSDLEKNGFHSTKTSLMRSQIMKNDLIDLIAVESVELPYNFFGIGSFQIMDRARVHAFTGYDNTACNLGENQEEIVYITKNGTVYHRDRNCSHLRISIKTVPVNQLQVLRNIDGGKYYECEYCRKKSAGGVVYITDYGDRYHNSVNCSGLKRDIMAIPLSQVSGRRPCKDCTKE